MDPRFGNIGALAKLRDELNTSSEIATAALSTYESEVLNINPTVEVYVQLEGGQLGWARLPGRDWGLVIWQNRDDDPRPYKDTGRALRIQAARSLPALTEALIRKLERVIDPARHVSPTISVISKDKQG